MNTYLLFIICEIAFIILGTMISFCCWRTTVKPPSVVITFLLGLSMLAEGVCVIFDTSPAKTLTYFMYFQIFLVALMGFSFAFSSSQNRRPE